MKIRITGGHRVLFLDTKQAMQEGAKNKAWVKYKESKRTPAAFEKHIVKQRICQNKM